MSLLLVKILQPLEPTCNNNNKKKKFFNDFDWPVPASFLATPWHRFSKAKKMPSTITTPPGVLCQVDSKIKITYQWSENLNIPEFGMTLQKPMNIFIDECDSFLHSRAVSPIKYQHRVDHLFILLFFSSFLLWLIASFELIDLSYQLPKFFPWHTTITLKHFDQKNPNSSPGVLCQVDVCLMVLGDCFKIAFYIYFTRKIMTGHFKKPFFSSLNGLLDHQTLWLYSLVMGNWNSIILSNFFCLVLWKVKAWPTKFWKYVVIIQVF